MSGTQSGLSTGRSVNSHTARCDLERHDPDRSVWRSTRRRDVRWRVRAPGLPGMRRAHRPSRTCETSRLVAHARPKHPRTIACGVPPRTAAWCTDAAPRAGEMTIWNGFQFHHENIMQVPSRRLRDPIPSHPEGSLNSARDARARAPAHAAARRSADAHALHTASCEGLLLGNPAGQRTPGSAPLGLTREGSDLRALRAGAGASGARPQAHNASVKAMQWNHEERAARRARGLGPAPRASLRVGRGRSRRDASRR